MEIGTSTDLTKHIQRLIDAPEGAFLVVELPDMVDAFLQFTAGPEAIKVDHPLISDIQRSREQAFLRACETIQRSPYESLGSDRARFLDCALSRGA